MTASKAKVAWNLFISRVLVLIFMFLYSPIGVDWFNWKEFQILIGLIITAQSDAIKSLYHYMKNPNVNTETINMPLYFILLIIYGEAIFIITLLSMDAVLGKINIQHIAISIAAFEVASFIIKDITKSYFDKPIEKNENTQTEA